VSLIAGTVTIPLVYALGRLTVGVAAGVLAAALLALTALVIDYSVQARRYALLMLLLCSSITLLLALRTGRRAWWVTYALCAAAGMYTAGARTHRMTLTALDH
jgi:uncharacterized membrane protein